MGICKALVAIVIAITVFYVSVSISRMANLKFDNMNRVNISDSVLEEHDLIPYDVDNYGVHVVAKCDDEKGFMVKPEFWKKDDHIVLFKYDHVNRCFFFGMKCEDSEHGRCCCNILAEDAIAIPIWEGQTPHVEKREVYLYGGEKKSQYIIYTPKIETNIINFLGLARFLQLTSQIG